MSDIGEVADNLGSTLASLEKVATLSPFKLKGFAKQLVQTADSTSKAGQAWTTFSRLSSGTPIWAAQNKIRAYLEILGGFEKRSKENMKALKEQNEETTAQVKKYTALTKSVKEFNAVYNQQMEKFEDLDAYKESLKAVNEQIEQTDTYAKMLFILGDADKARLITAEKMNKKQKTIGKTRKAYLETLRDEYAFDQSRLKTASDIAKQQAKVQGKGRFGQMMASYRGGRNERKSMVREQQDAVDREKKLGRQLAGTSDPIKLLASPILALQKTAQMAYRLDYKVFSAGRKFQKRSIEFTNKLQPIVSMAFKYFIMATLAIGAIFLLIQYAKEFSGMLEEFGVLEDIKAFGAIAIEFGKGLFETVKAFIDGGYEEGMKKLSPLLDKAILLLMKGGEIILKTGFLALVTGFYMLVDFIDKYFKDEGFRSSVNSVLLKVGKILLIAFFVKYLVSQALLLIGIYALPIMMGVVLLAALFAVAKYVSDEVDTIFGDKLDPLVDAYKKVLSFYAEFGKGLYDAVTWFVGWLASGQFATDIFNVLTKLFDLYIDKIVKPVAEKLESLKPKNLFKSSRASGGVVNNSGFTRVGENGPELVRLPQGSRVFNHQATKNMSSGTTVNNYITINAKDTSDNEMRRIAEKLSGMINQKINRNANSRMYG